MDTPSKPFSQACENNKPPILQIIKDIFTEAITVWEIGSGTGQHACHFAAELPHLTWQPTDRTENLAGIQLWLDETPINNIKPPLCLDVADPVWPCQHIEALFTANTLHIMSWQHVEVLFARLAAYLTINAPVCLYGPFNYQGRYTSDSNANFDQWLKNRDPLSGIRDFEAINALAEQAGLSLLADHPMPANNRLLVYIKRYSSNL
ncbi:MAG: DUF938 domain-containing protein [Methylococcaceae bacterium]|jgi:hypothetical protein